MELFGYKITKSEKGKDKREQSFVPPNNDDGAALVSGGGYYGTYVDMDAVAKSESDLITRYRQASLYPECDMAIEEIVNEAIASVDDEAPVKLNLEECKDVLSDKTIAIVEEVFERILDLLQFNNKGHDIFRRWYIDGRLYYHKIIDKTRPKVGIQEIRYIDPRKIRKVRHVDKEKLGNSGVEIMKVIEEFYVYNEQGISTAIGAGLGMPSNPVTTGIKIQPDSICHVSSGYMDMEKNVSLSYLHKAIKPVNQLKMMEDSLVIYRVSRAPERRIFYIDVGNLPKVKAEQYLKDVMNRYRNKIVYDSSTGEIRDDRKHMSMLEDFWLPRREGGRGTEIDTLPGGDNLGQIEDINYFKNKLYQSLNVPVSRLQQDATMIIGRSSEITREELKFAKFVDKLRKKFNALFADLLKTELLLLGVITEEDWKNIENKIQYRYAQDQYYKEAKESELLMNRLQQMQMMQQWIGVFFSQDYVKRNVLRWDDETIKEQQDLIDSEEPIGINNPEEGLDAIGGMGDEEPPPDDQANQQNTRG